MRIDRLLCELNIGSRSQVKELLKKGLIAVDGVTVKKADTQLDENQVVITFQGKEYRYCPYVYYMLNKPAGVVSATKDTDTTVMDVFKKSYLKQHDGDLSGIPIKDMFPVVDVTPDTSNLYPSPAGTLKLISNGELTLSVTVDVHVLSVESNTKLPVLVNNCLTHCTIAIS